MKSNQEDSGKGLKKESLIFALLILMFILGIFSVLSDQQEMLPESATQTIKPLKDGIAVLYLSGPISFNANPYLGSSYGVESFLEQVEDLEDNKHVKALVVRINSPGGTVGASQEMYRALLKLKEVSKIPIVASIGDVGASGAYYTALGSDVIFANPGSMVGSIGAYIGNINYSELAKRYGVDFQIYKSGEYKDMLSSWRPPTQKEKEILQQMVSNIHQQFVTALIHSRKLSTDNAYLLAQGQIFTGEQAKSLKLIDHTGGLREAILFAHQKAGLKGKPNIINPYNRNIYDLMNFWWGQLENRLSVFFRVSPELKW